MYFLVLYLTNSKAVYLVKAETVASVDRRLTAKESLGFSAYNPNDLKDITEVWVKFEDVKRVEIRVANGQMEN